MVAVSPVHSEQAVQCSIEVTAQVTVVCSRRGRASPDDHPVARREPVESVGHEVPETAGHEMAGHRPPDAAAHGEADPRRRDELVLSGVGIATSPSQRHDQRAA